jgi:molybdate transport system substrate-binding protein
VPTRAIVRQEVMMRRLLVSLAVLCGAVGCGDRKEGPVVVFAAASTKEVIEETGRHFEAETGVPVRCNPAASSTLARQIEQGGDADLFLSADEEWADYLGKRDLVRERRDLLANRLVVVTPAESPLKVRRLADLAGAEVHHLALALPAVPVGRYARSALKADGVWGRVEGRVLDAGDVRAALTYVARGEAEAGFVYATDAATTAKVRVALQVPEGLHPPIRYPLVLVRRDRDRPAARGFYDYLGGEAARAVFRRAGFSVVSSQ